jgi:hypothetical protein
LQELWRPIAGRKIIINSLFQAYTTKICTSHSPLLKEKPYIPGIAEKKAFTDKKDATEVAELVIKKIEKGEFPPNVSKTELESLLAR